MKKILYFGIGAVLTSVFAISINSVAAEKKDNNAVFSSKGIFEFHDKTSGASTIIDTNDFYLLSDEIDAINLEITEISKKHERDLNKLFIQVDNLDGLQDNKLSGKDIEKSYEQLLNGIESYANKNEKAIEVKEGNDNTSYIHIPKDGYYTKNSIIEVDNSALTKANHNFYDVIVEAINSKKIGLNKFASKEEIAEYIASNLVDGTKLLGTIKTNLNAGESVTISKGTYVADDIIIKTNPLSSQTSATASAEKILKNETAWVNGEKINGEMKNNGLLEWNPSSKTILTIPEGYYEGGTISTQAAYDLAYSTGYQDGLKNAPSTSNATINYVYHHHTTSGDIHSKDSSDKSPSGALSDNYSPSSSGGCWTVTAHTHNSSCYYYEADGYWQQDGPADYAGNFRTKCSRCGARGENSGGRHCYGQTRLNCNKKTIVTRNCGMSEGELISAFIQYK